MRVVLYYDLLRFSPRSIDLFIYMNISPPKVYPQIKALALAVCSRPIPFAWSMKIKIKIIISEVEDKELVVFSVKLFVDSVRKNYKCFPNVSVWELLLNIVWKIYSV